MNDYKLRVSIAVITYGHEQYIKQALDSILMQKTNFNYEIVVGEDCSPDDTRNILKEYENKYPDKFQMLYRDENLGPTKNIYDVLLHCSGDYIALLEGDDYWNNSNKIQKQVDFLDKHPEYIGVVHSCKVISDDAVKSQQKEAFYMRKDNSVFTFEDFKINRIPGHTCTHLFRNIFREQKYNYDVICTADTNTADRTINMLLLAQGDIYCIGEAMSTYRLIQNPGATNINSLYYEKNMLWKNWNYEMKLNKYCYDTFGKKFMTYDYLVSNYWKGALDYKLKRNNKEDNYIFRMFNIIIIKHPKAFIVILKKIIIKIKKSIKIKLCNPN